MKLKVDGIQFNLIPDNPSFNKNKIPILFLHGFTGCANDWTFLFNKLPQKFAPVAIDLIGHGDTDSPENQSHYSCGSIIYQIDSIIKQLEIEKFLIAGYSLGGRAALSYSVKYPYKILAAVFESTSAGMQDMTEKKLRVEHDLLLSDKIREKGVDWFLDFWLKQPIFGSLNKFYDLEDLKGNRSKNNAVGLANMLAGFSSGLMSCYLEELYYLNFPVLLLCGELDEKFKTINRIMSERFKDVHIKIIEDAGHNVHLEKPELFTKLVVEFLNSLERKQ